MATQPRERIITVAAGAGFTSIPVSMPCRHMSVLETTDGAGNFVPGVLQYQKTVAAGEPTAVDYATTFETEGPAQSIEVGNAIAEGNAVGPLVGLPVQPAGIAAYNAGTNYNVGDSVVYTSGSILAWVCLANGTVGVAPGSNSAKWMPLFNYRAADVPLQVRRQDGTATHVRVIEIP